MTTRRVDLIALKPLTYEGAAIAVGELFAASPIDAAKLQYRRQAKFAPKGVTRSVPTAPPVQHQAAVIPELPPSLPPPLVTRAESEPSSEPSSCVEPDPAIVAALPDPDLISESESSDDASEEPVEEPRKSRRYKRRDLQAED